MILSCRKPAVVIAHPDDETLGMGGTIARIARSGGEVTVILVTDGVSAQHQDEETKQRRYRGFEEACQILGVDRIVRLNFPDMRLDTIPHMDINDRLAEALRQGEHDFVFFHHHGDVNLDHRRIHESVMVCTRPTPGQPVKGLATFYVPSSSEWSFDKSTEFFPNALVDISETIQMKIDAMSKYVDETRESPHPRSESALRAMAHYWGSRTGVDCAEPFSIRRLLI